jgi:hypothetical protein
LRCGITEILAFHREVERCFKSLLAADFDLFITQETLNDHCKAEALMDQVPSVECRSGSNRSPAVSKRFKYFALPSLRFGDLTIVFERPRVRVEVAFTSFRFPETKSAHLKFSPLSDNNCGG